MSPHHDKSFHRWLIREKNIDPRVLLALATPNTIGLYRKEYNQWAKRKGHKGRSYRDERWEV
jgi:hypothetical protein